MVLECRQSTLLVSGKGLMLYGKAKDQDVGGLEQVTKAE